MSRITKIAFLGLLAALSIVLSYVEMLLPPIYPSIPGIKVGLTNIISLILIYKFSVKDTVAVTIIRLITVCLLFGNFMTLIYSLVGAFLSVLVMLLLKKSKLFSTLGVSIAGAVSHNLGQIIVAILIMQTVQIGYYMIVLLITGTLAGTVVGIAANSTLKYTDKFKI